VYRPSPLGIRPLVNADTRVCLACGAGVELSARFCSQCGRLLDGEATAAVASERTPPRLFGVASPDALFAAACLLLVFALIALVAGSWILAAVLLAPTLALLLLFYGAARQQKGKSAVARIATRSAHRTSAWASFGGRSIGAWTGAGRDILRLRRESRALRGERRRAQMELGDAAYREDEAAVTTLRSRMHEIDDELDERERARTATVANARRRVDDEHGAVRPTQQLSVDEPEPRGRG
jgi:hypothetical protein